MSEQGLLKFKKPEWWDEIESRPKRFAVVDKEKGVWCWKKDCVKEQRLLSNRIFLCFPPDMSPLFAVIWIWSKLALKQSSDRISLRIRRFLEWLLGTKAIYRVQYLDQAFLITKFYKKRTRIPIPIYFVSFKGATVGTWKMSVYIWMGLNIRRSLKVVDVAGFRNGFLREYSGMSFSPKSSFLSLCALFVE